MSAILTCATCGSAFHASRADARRCSAHCRQIACRARRKVLEESVTPGAEDDAAAAPVTLLASPAAGQRSDAGVYRDAWGFLWHTNPSGRRQRVE
jgi:hypothetical protein